ncbi:MAG: DsrE family protein [Rhodospirillales bacterium]
MSGDRVPDLSGLTGLSLIVLSGEFSRVHYALSMAAAAAAIDRKAILFFTNHALYALAKGDAAGPGWHRLEADAAGKSATLQDGELRGKGVAGFAELFDACIELDVRIIACEMGLRAVGLTPADLRPELKTEIAGLVTLYAGTSSDAQLVVI